MTTSSWQRGIAILTGLYVSRMLGMFMIFPVFSLYAQGLIGANEALAGLALGIYGLTQGTLQIPFGWLSDRFGRKPLILSGLILFLIGTVIAAQAQSIGLMIIGRAIQGMGAISSVALAYATDLVPVDKRGKTMAILGGSIGMAFVFSLILGPMIAGIPGVGVKGLFWVIAALALIAFLAGLGLPDAPHAPATETENTTPQTLWPACVAVLLLHATFTGAFVVLPKVLVDTGLPTLHQWWIYLPANLIAIAFMRYKAIPHPLNFGVSFVILALSFALMAMGLGFWGQAVAVTIFFIGFYRLETGLPHWVANLSGSRGRGKAMGLFSTAQFLGSFIGAAGAGALWKLSQPHWVFISLLLIAMLAALFLLSLGKRDTLRNN